MQCSTVVELLLLLRLLVKRGTVRNLYTHFSPMKTDCTNGRGGGYYFCNFETILGTSSRHLAMFPLHLKQGPRFLGCGKGKKGPRVCKVALQGLIAQKISNSQRSPTARPPPAPQAFCNFSIIISTLPPVTLGDCVRKFKVNIP